MVISTVPEVVPLKDIFPVVPEATPKAKVPVHVIPVTPVPDAIATVLADVSKSMVKFSLLVFPTPAKVKTPAAPVIEAPAPEVSALNSEADKVVPSKVKLAESVNVPGLPVA